MNEDIKTTREAYWRKEGYKRISVFLIRFAETVSLSIIPSLISVFLIIISQDPNGKAWKAFQLLSLLIFLVGNCIFYIKFALSGRSRKDFYAINIISYALFAVVTYVAYRYSDDVMFCSLTFATLRGFEGFGVKTNTSIMISHIVTMLLMVICEITTTYYVKLKVDAERREIWEQQQAIGEIAEEEFVTVQNNREVKFLSTEEMSSYISEESKEKPIDADSQTMPDGIIGEGFYKGRGDEVKYVSPENIDEAEEESAFLQDLSLNENAMYSADSLWERTVYQGRNSKNIPDRVYDLEDEKPDAYTSEDDEDDVEEYFGTLDEEDFYDDQDIHEKLSEEVAYTSEQLWEHSFYSEIHKNAASEASEVFDGDDDWETIVNINNNDAPYDGLWGDITKQGKKITAADSLDDLADELDTEMWSEPEIEVSENEYDSDNLWGNITKGRNRTEDSIDDDASSLELYDFENLWDKVVQGRDTASDDDKWLDAVLDNDINPYEDYDADSLWSEDIHQGRKKD